MTSTALFQMTHPEEGAAGQAEKLANDLNWLDFLAAGAVVNRTQTSTPGAPTAGQGWIAFAGVTGWTGTRNGTPASTFLANDVIFYDGSGFIGWSPKEGQRFVVTGEDIVVAYTGSAWQFLDTYRIETAISGNLAIQATAYGLGFGVSQLTTITTTALQAVRLPFAEAGAWCLVANMGANSALVFPSASDAINALGANNAYALANGKSALFRCIDGVTWYSVLGG